MSLDHKFAFAFVAGILLAAGTAYAGEVAKPATAQTTYLGNGASALTYWIDDADGRQVVTTVDTPFVDENGDDRHAIVRFSAHLLPGQSETVSVPSFGAAQPQELQIRRSAQGQGVEITRTQTTAALTRSSGAVD